MSDPILWAHKSPPPFRVRYAENGDQVVEKFPNTAPAPEEHPLHGQPVRRWELVLDPQGNVHACVYSGAAADYEGDHPRYGRVIRRRQKRQGWLPYGSCPISLRYEGAVQPRQLCPTNQAEELRPCTKGTFDDGYERGSRGPCVHMRAEEAFRKERNARREAARMKAFQSEADKILAQNAESLAKQGEAQTELVSTVTKLIQSITGGGTWPMNRPAMTPEEYAKAYAEAQHRGDVPGAQPPVDPSAPATDDELERLMREADAAALEDEPPTPSGKGKRK